MIVVSYVILVFQYFMKRKPSVPPSPRVLLIDDKFTGLGADSCDPGRGPEVTPPGKTLMMRPCGDVLYFFWYIQSICTNVHINNLNIYIYIQYVCN